MKSLKTSIFGMGMAITLLSACASGNETSLTVSGLDPAKFYID